MTKTFDSTVALSDVDFDLMKGQILGIVGHNGSGKSTLVKLLAGFHQADKCEHASIGRHDFPLGDAAAAHQLGLRFVHQDLGLVPTLSAVDNFCLQRGYARMRSGRVDWRQSRRAAKDSIARLGHDFDVEAPVSSLTPIDRTIIAVARATDDLDGVTAVILDEPTASLDRDDVRVLHDSVRAIAARGIGIAYITHHLWEIVSLTDAAVVLRDGEVVARLDGSEIADEDSLLRYMVGGESIAGTSSQDTTLSRSGTGPEPSRPVLSVSALTSASGELNPLTMDVGEGEVVGLAGLAGSGRESVIPAIVGTGRSGGTVFLNGVEVPPDVAAATSQGLSYLPRERLLTGLIDSLNARENLTLSQLSRHTNRGFVRKDSERAEVDEWRAELGIRMSSPDAEIRHLSGGNQQKVLLARCLRTEPDCLLLDEPTQGVDADSKRTIWAAVRETAARGAAVVLASSDEDELLSVCSRILIFYDANCTQILQSDRMTRDGLIQAVLTGGDELSSPEQDVAR